MLAWEKVEDAEEDWKMVEFGVLGVAEERSVVVNVGIETLKHLLLSKRFTS